MVQTFLFLNQIKKVRLYKTNLLKSIPYTYASIYGMHILSMNI